MDTTFYHIQNIVGFLVFGYVTIYLIRESWKA